MIDNPKKLIRYGLTGGFFLFIILYAFFNSRGLIFGVQIKNVNIVDGATVSNKVLKVTGNAKNAIKLVLNGREISLDQTGEFNETIILLKGYNIIQIEATDKFKHTDEKNYQLIYKDSNS